jgi:hypothetical protein
MNHLELALSYAANGIPCFPCRAEDEVTNQYDTETGEVLVLKAKTPLVSNGFKGATTNTRIINTLWSRHPNAMVGIPTGEQLGAWVLDIDVHAGTSGYPALAELEEKYGKLPDTATARTAGGGEHRYFKHVDGVRNRGALGVGLDIRGSGGYVICAGCETADGRKYEWINWDGEGMPPIADAPQWLLDLVTNKKQPPADHATYTPSGEINSAYVEKAVQAELDETAAVPMGAGRNNRLNAAAFALGQFVGASALPEHEARAMLRDVARGWGRDWTQCCKTIDNGLKAGMLQPRRDIPEATIYVDMPTDPHVVRRVIENAKAKKAAQEAEQIIALATPLDEDTTQIEYTLEAIDDLEALTYPGGLLEDLVNWIVSSSERPCRTLALAAAIPFIAALIGPRYSTGSRDTRPNIYTVALAESGFGKEHARSQIKRMLMADQGIFTKYSGPARIMSASALREVLQDHNSVNCQIDEFGGFIRDITDRKAGGHQRAISTDLRDYYSASSTYFEGAAYRGSAPKKIFNPNLCIHGTSTPEQFWSALSSASAEDGLLPRLILFHVKGQKPDPVVPERDVREVPYLLMERLAAVAGIDIVALRTSSLSGKVKIDVRLGENKPQVVPWTADALGVFESIKETLEEKEALVAPEARPFIGRIVENSIKLALIAAVGVDHKSPTITEAIVEWASCLSWTCAASMIAEVSDRLSDNQREANYKRIASVIKGMGDKGIASGKLADRLKAIDARQRDEILKDLQEAGRIVALTKSTGGRPSRRWVWAN